MLQRFLHYYCLSVMLHMCNLMGVCPSPACHIAAAAVKSFFDVRRSWAIGQVISKGYLSCVLCMDIYCSVVLKMR